MFCAKPRFTWRAYGARWGGSSLPRPLPALRSPQGATDMHDRHAPAQNEQGARSSQDSGFRTSVRASGETTTRTPG